MQGSTVVVCINKNDHLINVAIASVNFIGVNKVQKLWIEAYLQYHYWWLINQTENIVAGTTIYELDQKFT